MSRRIVTSRKAGALKTASPKAHRSHAVLPGIALVVAALAAGPAAATAVMEAQAVQPPGSPVAPAKPLVVPTAPVTPSAPSAGTPAPAGPVAPATADEQAQAAPEVHYGEEGLPEPVKALRRRILAAAKTGDIEQLRPIFQSAGQQIELSGGDTDDPIATLKLLSGDGAGREILAIMEDVFDAGWVHVDVGTPQDSYVWPYFARYPLAKLKPPQLVELFRLITAGDYQDMQDKGVYSFYRAGIAPDGTWQFFEDGD